jgi:hypothetical protein
MKRLFAMNCRRGSLLPPSMAPTMPSTPALSSGGNTKGAGSTITMAATLSGWAAPSSRTVMPPMLCPTATTLPSLSSLMTCAMSST